MASVHLTTLGAGERVVLVHGSFGWAAETFAAQRELADRFELNFLDRRGHGQSPPAQRVDFEVDAGDIAEALGDGAHLLGHSYGAVGCLLAAARRPEAVKSLAVIEPPAFGLARGHACVETLLKALVPVYARAASRTPVEHYRAFMAAAGLPLPSDVEFSADDLRAMQSATTERAPWEAHIPLETLAAAGLRVLVMRGAWDNVPPAARDCTGPAFAAVCEVLSARLSAPLLTFERASHNPQRRGAPVNAALREFWSGQEPV